MPINQQDIVERLRGKAFMDIHMEAADEIERLRKERDGIALLITSTKAELQEQLATVTKERDELVALLEEAVSYTSCETWSPSLTEEINAALAKLGADKTGAVG